jgi:hypothetical protein
VSRHSSEAFENATRKVYIPRTTHNRQSVAPSLINISLLDCFFFGLAMTEVALGRHAV